MRTRTAYIKPHNLDFHQWERRVIRGPLLIDGKPSDFEGEALVSCQAGQGHSIAFEFVTSVYRSAKIAIPLWLDLDASIKLFVDDQALDVEPMKCSDGETPEVCILRKDLTTVAEARRTLRLRLVIAYRGGNGIATFPMECGGQLEWRPVLIQAWSWRYAIRPLLFFAFAWGCILELAILLLSEIRPLGDKFRYYAVLTVVLAWIGGVLGIPDLAKIPLRPLLRRLYGLTRPRRVGSLLALVLCFAALSFPAWRVVYCLSVRQRYTNLIERVLRDEQASESIRRAFVLLPWRKEAQALFEVSAYKTRNPGYAYASTRPEFMAPYREYVTAFVKGEGIHGAVQKVLTEQARRCCLRGDETSATSDPVIWYSSILPESTKGDAGTEEAVKFLSTYRGPNGPEANLLRLSLQLYLDRENDKTTASADKLLRALGRAGTDHLESTFSYQLACDYLASHYVRFCQSSEAYDWFKNEINARDLQQQYRFRTGSPLWGRPPQKLILPYMFLLYGPMKGQDVSGDSYFLRAQRLLTAYLLPCDPPFQKEFEANLLNRYANFQQWDAWLKGTLLDKDIKLDQYINQSLNEGWRY